MSGIRQKNFRAMKRIKDIIDTIVKITAEEFEVTPLDIYGKKRTLHIQMARHMSIALSKRILVPSLTYTRLGLYFQRDHSTIIHSCRKSEDLVEIDPNYREVIKKVVMRIEMQAKGIKLKQFPVRELCNPVKISLLIPCVSV
jgi:chromosomal replication initiator protein